MDVPAGYKHFAATRLFFRASPNAGSGILFPDSTQGGASLHFVPLRLPWAKFCRRRRRLVDW